MQFTLESVNTDVSANRSEINEGFFGGVSAIVKPTVFICDFYSLDKKVKVQVSIPEDHLFADEISKLQKGIGSFFTLQML